MRETCIGLGNDCFAPIRREITYRPVARAALFLCLGYLQEFMMNAKLQALLHYLFIFCFTISTVTYYLYIILCTPT